MSIQLSVYTLYRLLNHWDQCVEKDSGGGVPESTATGLRKKRS